MNENNASTRPAPTPQSVRATLTRDERINISKLLDISASNALRYHRGNGADPALAVRSNRAENAAHALWRNHGFKDLPTYRLSELIG